MTAVAQINNATFSNCFQIKVGAFVFEKFATRKHTTYIDVMCDDVDGDDGSSRRFFDF